MDLETYVTNTKIELKAGVAAEYNRQLSDIDNQSNRDIIYGKLCLYRPEPNDLMELSDEQLFSLLLTYI